MGNKLTKKQKAQRKKKNTQNRIKKLEKQDALGISRHEVKHGLDPKVWIILKIISIVIVPIVYFIYSPLLIVAMMFSILMFVFATMTERRINNTYVKSRHMKIHKFDSIIAVIVILITITTTIISSNTKKQMPFNKMFGGNAIVRKIESFGSCSTGSRSVIKRFKIGMKAPSFGNASPPPGMPPKGEFKKLEMSDLPIEMVFSMAVSSVNSVLIFMVPVSGAITLWLYFRRKNKFDIEMNEIINDSLPEIDDAKLEELFKFGYEIIEEEDISIEQTLDDNTNLEIPMEEEK